MCNPKYVVYLLDLKTDGWHLDREEEGGDDVQNAGYGRFDTADRPKRLNFITIRKTTLLNLCVLLYIFLKLSLKVCSR